MKCTPKSEQPVSTWHALFNSAFRNMKTIIVHVIPALSRKPQTLSHEHMIGTTPGLHEDSPRLIPKKDPAPQPNEVSLVMLSHIDPPPCLRECHPETKPDAL